MHQGQSQEKKLRSAYTGAQALVVGGSGFIGRAVTEALASLGAEVVALSRRPGSSMPDHPQVSRLAADVTDRQRLSASLGGRQFDYAFNLGGEINHARYHQSGRQVVETHFGGLLNLLDALNFGQLKGFVQVGSSDEYGNAPAPQAEDQRETPFSPYSAAKVAATHFVQSLALTEGFPGTVVRYFLVYGPGQDSRRFLPQVIKGALEGREFPTSSGEQLRDFCYLDDAVQGMLLAGALPQGRGEVFNIASGRPVAIREVIKSVIRLVGQGKPFFGAHPLRSGENMALYADTTKARNLLGFEASISLEQGLSRTIAWFRQRGEGR